MSEAVKKELEELENDPIAPKKLNHMESYNSLNQGAKAEPPKERPKLEAVATGKEKKKSGLAKFAEDINLKENSREVGNYVVKDVIVPALKKTITDVVAGGLNVLFYGTASGSGKSSWSYGNGTNYNSISSGGRPPQQQRQQNNAPLNSIIYYDTRDDAERVLSCMCDLIIDYGVCSVADMYDLSGKTWAYTQQSYGWTDLGDCKPVYCKDGWYITLPRPKRI